MSGNYVVELQEVQKSFCTRHFLHRDEHTHKRRLYTKKVVSAAAGINFGIRKGEIFGLLGPNGAGKTTCVKMISGLVRPDRGKVLVNSLDVEKHRKRILRQVGVVLEGTRTSIWPLTPLENLTYYGNLRDMSGEHLSQRSHELLDFIGLQEKKNVQVRYLSRGQKQKLAICIALISDPQVLLLDEPTTGLDVQSARMIKDKLIEITREKGKSVLVTTHDMHVAQELCDRIGIINHGQLVACRETGELLDLFSDQVFIFKLDRMPEEHRFSGIPGVLEATAELSDDGPLLAVTVMPEFDLRSEALYGVVESLRGQGLRLRSITHRQQNLETIFLRLTTSA